MKKTFTLLFLVVAAFLRLYAQPLTPPTPVAGDYRTNTTAAVAQWNNVANWETFNGTSWIAASSVPNNTSGTIFISAGDSIQITGFNPTIDQVWVESTASLLIFTSTTTLANGTGDDITVQGKLYVASGGTLTTSTGATVVVDENGYMQLRNGGILSANTINNGVMEQNLSTLTNATVTNNNILRFIETSPSASNYNVTLNNGVIQNNGSIEVTATTNVLFSGASGTNTLTNAATASIIKLTSTGTFGTNNSGTGVAVTNAGTIGGVGTISFGAAPSTIVNTGTISPGTAANPIGILAISPNAIAGNTSTIRIDILNTSGAGTGNDRLDVTNPVNLNGNTLTIVDFPQPGGSAALGTYTIMTTTVGNFSGTFTTTNLPTGFTNVVVGASTVTVQKTSFPLPVHWGEVSAAFKNNQVYIDWTTLEEQNTSQFVIEHSASGKPFTSIGVIPARANSSGRTEYHFIHRSPSTSAPNLYRLRQVDIDGKTTYSKIFVARINGADRKPVEIISTTVNNQLQILVNRGAVDASFVGSNGTLIRKQKLSAGLQTVDVSTLQFGVYYIQVFENDKLIGVEKFIKQ